MSGDPLAAAVIGLGSMGANHVRVFEEIDGIRPVAVADPSPQRLAAAGAGPSRYRDYREMLGNERLDLVSICVPTRLHREVALAAVAAGVAALVEKPIAATLDEGREMADAARRAGVPLMIGHVERFNPAVQELKRRLDRGELGRVFQVYARRTGPFPERVRDVGVVLDLAPHDIDVMRFLLGSDVERVFAETQRRISTEHEDMLSGLLRFRNGAVGVLEVNWLTPFKIRTLSALGEKGMFNVDYLTQRLVFYPQPAEAPAPAAVSLGGDGHDVPVEKKEPLRAELEAFVEAVEQRNPPPVGPEEGLAALEIASLLVDSARSGRPVIRHRPETAR